MPRKLHPQARKHLRKVRENLDARTKDWSLTGQSSNVSRVKMRFASGGYRQPGSMKGR